MRIWELEGTQGKVSGESLKRKVGCELTRNKHNRLTNKIINENMLKEDGWGENEIWKLEGTKEMLRENLKIKDVGDHRQRIWKYKEYKMENRIQEN